LSPGFRRDLIRAANREHFNSTEVAALLEYAEVMIDITGEHEDDITVVVLLSLWKDSFDEPQP